MWDFFPRQESCVIISHVVIMVETSGPEEGPAGIRTHGQPFAMTLSPSIVAALRHLLRPLVRLLVARGVTYPMLAELLKETYIDVADRDFRLDAKPATDSRLSLLSGGHRKDVRRLRGHVPVDA